MDIFGPLGPSINEILESEYHYSSEEFFIGAEIEYSIVDHGKPSDEKVRNIAVESLSFAEKEFGSTIAEIVTDPFEPSSLDELYGQLLDREKALAKMANSQGAQVLRYGSNPFLSIDEFSNSTGARYRDFSQLLEYSRNQRVHSDFGRFKSESFDPRDIGFSGMITSLQPNFQVKNFDKAIKVANRLYMVQQPLIAITGNSRIINRRDTGYSDARVPLWEKCADTRPLIGEDSLYPDPDSPIRVGKLESYYTDIPDYLSGVAELAHQINPEEDNLQNAIKSYWKDVKIKFYGENESPEGNSIVVESRPFSTQPTALEDISIMAYLTGRLEYSINNEEELMDIEKVNRNRYSAMHNGLDTKLYDPEDGYLRNAGEVMKNELKKAEKGLSEFVSNPDDYLQPLYDRLSLGYTPGDKLAEKFQDLMDSGIERDDALRETFSDQMVKV